MFSPRQQVFNEKVLVSCDPEGLSAPAERKGSEDEKTAAEVPEVRVVHFSNHIILFRPDVRGGGFNREEPRARQHIMCACVCGCIYPAHVLQGGVADVAVAGD